MFGKDIGIDLGTANTLVFMKGKGIIMREPSVVAVDTRNYTVKYVGQEAKDVIGRTPGSIVAVRPLKDGVIADFDITASMLQIFIKKACNNSVFARPRVVICIPSGVTAVERRAVKEASLKAGARAVAIIEEPMAAAIGAGLPVAEATGSMVVDIGGGTSEVAVISLGGIVASRSVRVGGDEFDSAIKGRNLVDGLPKNMMLHPDEVREALADSVMSVLDAIRTTLERTPPELSADIIDHGITLTGGGALLRGLDQLISKETGMPVQVAENPLDCVAAGTGKLLENINTMKELLSDDDSKY